MTVSRSSACSAATELGRDARRSESLRLGDATAGAGSCALASGPSGTLDWGDDAAAPCFLPRKGHRIS